MGSLNGSGYSSSMSSHTIRIPKREPSRNLVTHGGIWLAERVLTTSSHWRRRGKSNPKQDQPKKWRVYKTSSYFGSPRGAVESLKRLLLLAYHGSSLFLDYDLLSVRRNHSCPADPDLDLGPIVCRNLCDLAPTFGFTTKKTRRNGGTRQTRVSKITL